MTPSYQVKRLIIGADHFGLPLKDAIAEHLREAGLEVEDIGVSDENPVDYPDIGEALAKKIADGSFERGILVCGTGAGMAITANKVPGVRAVSVQDPYSAERAIASNNAQVITFGAQITGPKVATMLADIYLSNRFQGGRSAPKVEKMEKLDQTYRKAG
ncbi:MAG: RpiB/LacA/LacB family sugar-phosphate isomerase [Geminicoccaceae bacterium]